MTLELTPERRDLLLGLVNEAIREIGPEIHHARISNYKEDLKRQQHELWAVRELLSGAPATVEAGGQGEAGGTADAGRGELVGTA